MTFPIFVVPAAVGPLARVDGEVRLDEAGVDRQPARVPHLRVRRRDDVGADGLDRAVADDDGRRREDLAGARDDAAADEGVHPVSIERVLVATGLPTAAPEMAPARSPPLQADLPW